MRAAHHQRRQPRRAHARSGSTTRRDMPRAWPWRAATPTSPLVLAVCASSTSPTRPRRPRSASTTRRGCQGVAWRAATPTSPMAHAVCASSTSPTRPPQRGRLLRHAGDARAWRWRAATPTSPMAHGGLRVINVANPAAPTRGRVLRHAGVCLGCGRGGQLRLRRRLDAAVCASSTSPTRPRPPRSASTTRQGLP